MSSISQISSSVRVFFLRVLFVLTLADQPRCFRQREARNLWKGVILNAIKLFDFANDMTCPVNDVHASSVLKHQAARSANSGLLPILELLLQILDLLLVFKMVEHSRCLNATRAEDTFRCAQDIKPTIQPICKWKYFVFSIRVDIRRRDSSCYTEIRLNTNYRNI